MSPQTVSEREAPRFTRAVKALIATNVAILFLQVTVFGKPSIENYLGFSWDVFSESKHWWAVGTYLFVHDNLLSLAVNMYALFLFGPRLEATWGTKRFTRFYFFCGIGSLLGYVAFVHNK